jgi:hypothetical protein
VSKLQESPALLCKSPKLHNPGPGRRHVIRAKNLPKHAIFAVVRPALPHYIDPYRKELLLEVVVLLYIELFTSFTYNSYSLNSYNTIKYVCIYLIAYREENPRNKENAEIEFVIEFS